MKHVHESVREKGLDGSYSRHNIFDVQCLGNIDVGRIQSKSRTIIRTEEGDNNSEFMYFTKLLLRSLHFHDDRVVGELLPSCHTLLQHS